MVCFPHIFVSAFQFCGIGPPTLLSSEGNCVFRKHSTFFFKTFFFIPPVTGACTCQLGEGPT